MASEPELAGRTSDPSDPTSAKYSVLMSRDELDDNLT